MRKIFMNESPLLRQATPATPSPAKGNLADVIIIGAGLSGVTYAHYAANAGKKVTLLEKRDTPGGCIYTTKLLDDFFTETGAHTFYSSYATLIEMIRKLGLWENILHQKKQSYKMLVDGKVKSLLSQASIARMILGFFLMGGDKSGKTVQEFYGKAFGEKNFEKFIRPVTSAVICQDSAQFAADLLLKSRPKDKDKSLKSFSVKDGLGGFISAAAKTEGVSLYTSTTVSSVERKDGGWLVKTDDGREFAAPRLVMATEAPQAAALMGLVSPALAEHLKKLPMTSSTAFSVATEAENMNMKPFGYLISTSLGCRSVVSRDVLPDNKHRGFTVHFKEAEFAAELPALYNVLGIKDSGALKSFQHTFTLPRLGVGHHKWLAELKEITAGIEGFDLLGNFYGGLALEDCALRAKEAASLC
jgi:protoporphyrinogen oxidase